MSTVEQESPADERLLKMSELVEASGVPGATIKHYLREGLLPEPVKIKLVFDKTDVNIKDLRKERQFEICDILSLPERSVQLLEF